MNGSLHGLYSERHDQGGRKITIDYRNGVKESFSEWYPSGILKEAISYDGQGGIGYQNKFNENGELIVW